MAAYGIKSKVSTFYEVFTTFLQCTLRRNFGQLLPSSSPTDVTLPITGSHIHWQGENLRSFAYNTGEGRLPLTFARAIL